MVTDVLVTHHSNNYVSASAIALFSIVANGETEAEAIERLREALTELQQHSRVVQVDLLPLDDAAHPWLRFAGLWANDPDWQAFEEALEDAHKGG